MNRAIEIAQEHDLVKMIWPLVWQKDYSLYLPDSVVPKPNYYKFDKGDRVIYPKQVDYLEALWYFDGVFFGGAASGGKTHIGPWGVALYLMDQASKGFSGGHGVIFSETQPILYKRHISVIGKWFPEWIGKFVGRPYNEFRASEEYGGWVLEYRSTDKFDVNERSTEYMSAFIDESTNQPEAFYDHIQTRMRWTKDGQYVEHCPVGLASNPVGIGLQWHLRRFVRDGRDGEQRESDGPTRIFVEGRGYVEKAGHKFIQALPTDNPANSDKYLAELKMKPPKIRDAYYYGKWGSFEGQFFDLDSEAHTFPNSMRIDPAWPRYMAVDWATGHTACAYAGAVDWDGCLWVYDGFSTVGVKAIEFKKMMAETFVNEDGTRTKFAIAVADPSMWAEESVEGNKTPIEILNNDDEYGSFRLQKANHDPGSRIVGWGALREGFMYRWKDSTDKFGRYRREVVTPPEIRIATHLRYVWMSLTISLQRNPHNSEDCLKTNGQYGPGEGDDEGETVRDLNMCARRREFRAEEPPKTSGGNQIHRIPGSGGAWDRYQKKGSIWV